MAPSALGRLVISLAALVAGCGPEPSGPPGPAPDPSELAAPPAGEGFQMQTEDISVAPGNEVQDCYFFKVSELAAAAGLPADRPVNLHRVQIAQRDGSHHMNIFRVRSVVGLDPDKGRIQKGLNGEGECFASPNWADWPLVANSQQDGRLDWSYPEGVANELAPDEWIMLQTHYVNASTQKTPAEVGRVRVNFWSIPEEEVTAHIGTLFATKQSVRVCRSNPEPVYEGSCQFGKPGGDPVRIIGANGHFHARGSRFEMYAWDGASKETPGEDARFYTSTSWDDPPMLTSPELDRAVPSGGGVWYSCGYRWAEPEPSVGCEGLDAFDEEMYGTDESAQDCCYTFGPIVEKNEHCNAFVYYYPKRDDVNCF